MTAKVKQLYNGINRASEFLNWYKHRVGSKHKITVQEFHVIVKKMDEFKQLNRTR